MKRLLLLFCAGFLIMISASAQIKPTFSLGIKAGANFNRVDGKYWEDNFKANYLAGLYTSLNWTKVGVQVEGNFVQSTFTTGSNFYDLYNGFYKNVGDSLKSGSRFKINTITVPVLLNLKLFSKATIQLGPQFSGIVQVDDKDQLLNDAKSLFKSGAVSGVIGLWINLPANLNVGARYIIGFSNLNEKNNLSAVDDAWKQRSVQVHLGYTFIKN